MFAKPERPEQCGTAEPAQEMAEEKPDEGAGGVDAHIFRGGSSSGDQALVELVGNRIENARGGGCGHAGESAGSLLFRGEERCVKKRSSSLFLQEAHWPGVQKPEEDEYGKSITDPCLGWEKSESLIMELAELTD